MIVNLPVLYTAEVLSKSGTRWFKKMPLLRVVQAEVPEVSADEVEVSATGLDFGNEWIETSIWHDGSNWIRETTGDSGRRPPERIGPHDGARLAPLMVYGRGWNARLEEVEGFTSREAFSVKKDWLEKGMPLEGKYDDRPKRLSSFDRERARLDAYLRDVMLVDGALYRRIGVPFFKVDWDGRKGYVWLAEGYGAGEWGGFRLDRMDDLKAHIERNFGEDCRCVRMPEIRLPQAFAWNDEEESFDAAFAFAMEFARKHKGWGEDRDKANKALWEADAEGRMDGMVDRDRLAEGLEAFGEINQRRNEISRSNNFEAWEAAHVAKAAVDRWRLRPLAPDADFGEDRPQAPRMR